MSVNEGKSSDGKGGLNQQFVNADGRAGTNALAQNHQSAAVEEGLGYTLHSTYSLTGGEEAVSLANNGDDIHVEKVIVSTSATGIVSVMRATSGTPAGTTITAKNMKLGLAVAPEITAFGNASVTGSVDGDIIDSQDVGTTAPHTFELDGLIVPLDETLFVRFATNGVVHVTIYFHRE